MNMTHELKTMQDLLGKFNRADTEDEQTFGMVCYLVSEDKVYNYTRLINKSFLTADFKIASFFSDDMMYSFQTVVKENKI